ncbi:ABC transporter substrate-binding protein [Arcanobacterium hippocoleae]|uniref:ABC transport system substrate-binding protein n=1 Tax=Arcanobacterium hippocoleae TaxID=149017 RepID=A0ABU1T160_9ACTO|nr:ABC transporter substrate-binding protein [Arcanobacterium hippocoleae]MDR6939107.1 putative ABC transport system substrate-binding protein [Arcanobacterium hippocoleae]
MKKISAIGSFLIGGLLVLVLVMPSLQRLHQLESGTMPAANTASKQTSGSKAVDLVPEGYQPVGAKRITNNGKTKEIKDGRVLKIGMLQLMEHPSLDDIRYGLIDQLAKRGYINGINLEIEYQQGQGDQNLLKSISDDFMADGKDLLIGIATPAAQALMNAAQGEVPVVFAGVSDPVGAGLANSLAGSGKMVAGSTFASADKETLELIRQITPQVKTIGLIYNTSEQNAAHQVQEIKALAPAAGFTVKEASITNTNELKQVAEQLVSQVDALFVPEDNTIAAAMDTLIPVTNAAKVPVYTVVDAMVKAGGLATVGLNQYVWGADSGDVVADVLDGADVPSLPVNVSNTKNTIVNTDAAAMLGITIPENILQIAIDLAASQNDK